MSTSALQILRTTALESLGDRPPHRFRYPALDHLGDLSPDFSAALSGVVACVRELLKRTGLPDDLTENPYYSSFLLGEIPEEDEPMGGTALATFRNIWNRFPFRPNTDTARKNIDRVTEHVITAVKAKEGEFSEEDLIRRNIQRTVTFLIDYGIRGVNNYPLNRCDLLNQEAKGKKGKFFSMETLRSAVITVQDEVKGGDTTEEDAIIRLLSTVGILDDDEAYDASHFEEEKRELERQLSEYLTKAWTLYDRIQKIVNDVIDEKLAQNGGEKNGVEPLETSSLLRQLDLFHLLEVVFTKRVSGIEEYTNQEFSESDFHEAQGVAALFYDFAETAENPSFKNSGALTKSLERKFRNGMFHQGLHRRKGTLYTYEEGSFVAKAGKKSPILSKLQSIPSFGHMSEDQRLVSIAYFRKKGRTSSVIRRLARSPEMSVHQIPDMIAGRIVLWGFNLAEIVDPQDTRTQDYLRAVARMAGSSLDLQYNPAKDNMKEELTIGEFCVENKLGEPYPSYRVYGCLKAHPEDKVGIRCEIQIIPRDVHEMVEANNSPLDHDNYDIERHLRTFLTLYPASLFKNQRAIVREKLQKMLIKKKEAFIALHKSAHAEL